MFFFFQKPFLNFYVKSSKCRSAGDDCLFFLKSMHLWTGFTQRFIVVFHKDLLQKLSEWGVRSGVCSVQTVLFLHGSVTHLKLRDLDYWEFPFCSVCARLSGLITIMEKASISNAERTKINCLPEHDKYLGFGPSSMIQKVQSGIHSRLLVNVI